MKNRTSKKKTLGSKFVVYTPKETGDERKRTILRRIGFFKESAIITVIMTFLGIATYYKNSPEVDIKIMMAAAAAPVVTFLITSGLYLLYFEVGNFGFPKERNFLKFKRAYTYMMLFLQICSCIGINVAGLFKEETEEKVYDHVTGMYNTKTIVSQKYLSKDAANYSLVYPIVHAI